MSRSIPFQSLAYLMEGRGEGESIETVLAIDKTFECYQQYFRHKCKVQHHMGCFEESQLHLSQTQYVNPQQKDCVTFTYQVGMFLILANVYKELSI